MRRLIQSFLSIFLIILIGWQLQAKENESEHLIYAHEIIDAVAPAIEKKFGIICIGSGGQMAQKVEQISIDFRCYQKTNIEEARKMMIIAMNYLVDKVNTHEKIRPFLSQYPFTLEGADICISFYQPYSDFHYRDGNVALVCQAKGGKIAYKTAELQTRKNYGLVDKERDINIPDKTVEIEVLVPLLKETYEEALRIVNSK